MSALTSRDESDYDSSSSSITVPESSRSWMSNLSFESRRSSISVCSSRREPFLSYYGTGAHKPHKANQVAWEVMRRLLWSKGGQVGLEHFRLLRRLGSGDIGNVYLCQIRNPVVGLPQCFYAMKVVDKEALVIRNKLQRAEMEKEIVGMLDHPFLPTLYTHFEASHYSCWVMEYCPGGDLYAARQRQPAKRFSVSSAKFYAAETLLALEYLHMMGIVYRDLKPENVLVREDGHIMLTDFDLSFKCDVVPKLLKHNSNTTSIHNNSKHDDEGEDNDHNVRCSTPSCIRTPLHPVLSCFSVSSSSSKSKRKHTITTTIREYADHDQHNHQDQTMVVDINKNLADASTKPELVAEPMNARSKSFVGTHEYLAPEVISGQGHGSAVDWWTLGVFIYEMLYGKTPFKGENNEKTLMNILKQPLTFPKLNHKDYTDQEMVKAEDLLRKLLVKNPKKRIGSLKGSVEIKRHEFFKGVNWALIRSVKPPVIPAVHNLTGSRSYWPKYLSKKDRDAPYQIPHQHFDYF